MRRSCWFVVYFFIKLLSKAACYCEGEWLDSDSLEIDAYSIAASRVRIDPSNYTTTVNEFLRTACPAQVVKHSCYYLGDRARAEKIENRRWVLNASKSGSYSACYPFRPVEFLSMLRNKRVFFYGDSVMGELFISLFCSLFSISESSYKIHFIKLFSCDHILCPLNGPQHSHFVRSSIVFKEFNATFFYYTQSFFNVDIPQFIEANNINANDIILMNSGLHYNDPVGLRKDLVFFRDSLQGRWNQSQTFRENFPFIIQLESTPQHFPLSFEGKPALEQGNGYYIQYTGSYKGEMKCGPFIDPDVMNNTVTRQKQLDFAFKQDWRNRIVDEELEPLLRHQSTFAKDALKTSNVSLSQLYQQFSQSPTIYRIPIAKGLYDQYDAHIETAPFPYAPFDCTHWCFPSNVDRYMHLMLFNGIRRAMLQRKEARWLKTVHQLPANVLKDKLLADTAKENEQAEKDRKWKVYMLPPSVTPGSLVKVAKRSEVYFINDGGEKQAFWSWSAFVSRGYDASQIMTIAESELVMIPDGEPLT